MQSFIYLRGLRRAEHTVFCVQDGQKYYYDPQFGTRCAYSSGQQVKRSVLDAVLDAIGAQQAPVTFNYEVTDKNAIANKEPWSPCDPAYPDQLLGGWMKAQPNEIALKRRSPFSFSAMRPLHPLLGGLEGQKENLTFDRSSNPNRHPVVVKNAKGEVMADADVLEFLAGNKRTLPRRNWIPDNTRATGLFIYDIAIDLRPLFSVSTNQHEPEITSDKIEALLAAGWVKGNNVFGECITAPVAMQKQLLPAIAQALINWRITSNQARTFSLMETLAVAISTNANAVAGAIRADLHEEKERCAIPVLDHAAGATVFVALPANGYIQGANGTAAALQQAEQTILALLQQ